MAALQHRPVGAGVMSLVATVLAALLCGCVYLPLPDSTPSLQEARLPRIGEPVAGVRQRFGKPQLLDDGRHLVYDWAIDRAFVMIPLIPSGMPGVAVVDGQRFRMLVSLDAAQRVSTTACSIDRLDGAALQAVGCLDTAALQATLGEPEPKRLEAIDGLAGISFRHRELGGADTAAALSPDGRWLAGVDVSNRTWMIDLDVPRVAARHDGTAPDFWSLRGVWEPRPAFSADSRRLLIAQGIATSLHRLDLGQGPVREPLGGADVAVAQFACCPDGFVGLGADRIWPVDETGGRPITAAGEGRIAFAVDGATVSRAAPAGQPLLAALDSSALEASPRALFSDGRIGNAVFDTRNPLIRQSAQASYAFSPDGRWLARNSCRALALWESDQLAKSLRIGPSGPMSATRVMIMPLPRQASYEDGCHGPVAFSSDGALVAAAGHTTVHLWRVDDGRQLGFADLAEEFGPRRHVVALALDRGRGLSALVSDFRGDGAVLRWPVPAAPPLTHARASGNLTAR